MNKEQQQIIDVVYANHSKEYEKDNSIGISRAFALTDGTRFYRKIDKETFIALCTCDEAFSEQWGLQIEERELSEKERIILAGYDYENRGGIGWNMVKESVDMDSSIPTKLITITYNNTTIESYER
jgi:hypothetical protein